jgi:hypothetical protein
MERDSFYSRRPLSPSEHETNERTKASQARDREALTRRIEQTEADQQRAKEQLRQERREALEREVHERYLDAGGDEAGWLRDGDDLVMEALRRKVLDGHERMIDEARATGIYRPLV